MIKLKEYMDFLHLRETGYSISSISRITGKDRKTIRKYLNHSLSDKMEYKRRNKVDGKLKSFEPYLLNLIHQSDFELPPCTVIYQKLAEKGYTGSLSLLQKWVKQYRQQHFPKVIIRYETPPGLQAQVDWGEKKIKDKSTGLVRKVYIFCMTLSYSRMRFVHFVPKADMYYFLYCHKKAFAYFGGVPREILYDQNRCVLVKPGFRDITFNTRFLDFAHHYGFIPRVCKPYRPQTKGKVENTIRYVKRNFLSMERTALIPVLNQRKRTWLNEINNKVHSTTSEIPSKRLVNEKLQGIRCTAEYDLYYMESRKVFNDSTFSFYGQRYSVPPIYIGKTVTVKYRPNNLRIDVYHKEKLITQHRADSGDRYVIKRSHRYSLWKIWRGDKKLFYQQVKAHKNSNHPLALYEQISLMDHLYVKSANA